MRILLWRGGPSGFEGGVALEEECKGRMGRRVSSSPTRALVWTSTVSPLASPTEPKQAQMMYDYSTQHAPAAPSDTDILGLLIDLSNSAHAPHILNSEPQGYPVEELLRPGRDLEHFLGRVGLALKVERVRSVRGGRNRWRVRRRRCWRRQLGHVK